MNATPLHERNFSMLTQRLCVHEGDVSRYMNATPPSVQAYMNVREEYMSLFRSLSLSLSISLSFSLSLCISLGLSLSLSLFFSVSLSFFLSVFFFVSLSFSLSLKYDSIGAGVHERARGVHHLFGLNTALSLARPLSFSVSFPLSLSERCFRCRRT